MCGISGIWWRHGDPVDHDMLRGMNAMLAHRGPDGDQLLVEGEIGFGHRRLSILDLSDRGNQPMVSADGNLWLTFSKSVKRPATIRLRLSFSFPNGVSPAILRVVAGSASF